MIKIERYKLKTPAILDSWCFHLKKLCFHEKTCFKDMRIILIFKKKINF